MESRRLTAKKYSGVDGGQHANEANGRIRESKDAWGNFEESKNAFRRSLTQQ